MSPSRFNPEANSRAARIGPMVWELDGPMPTLKMSKTLRLMRHLWAAGARAPCPAPAAHRCLMSLSVFDIFKVGIGPSSSHTMGPMRAAREFALGLKHDGLIPATREIAVRLYGSLALTGVGHGTDRAVLAGLAGAQPETIDPDSLEPTVQRIRSTPRLRPPGEHEI